MKKATHYRKDKSIQNIETRAVETFESINKAKAHVRKTFALGELRVVDKLLPKK